MNDATYYIRQLDKYKTDLKMRRSSVGRFLSETTIRNRETGAEDFALFLLGLECPTERIRGALVGERTQKLMRRSR